MLSACSKQTARASLAHSLLRKREVLLLRARLSVHRAVFFVFVAEKLVQTTVRIYTLRLRATDVLLLVERRR